MWLEFTAGSTGFWSLSGCSGEELTYRLIILVIFALISTISLIVIPLMFFRAFLARKEDVRQSTIYILLVASLVLTLPFSMVVKPYYPALALILCFIFWVSMHAAAVVRPFAMVRIFMGSMLIGLGVFSVLMFMFFGVSSFMKTGSAF